MAIDHPIPVARSLEDDEMELLECVEKIPEPPRNRDIMEKACRGEILTNLPGAPLVWRGDD